MLFITVLATSCIFITPDTMTEHEDKKSRKIPPNYLGKENLAILVEK